MYSPANNMDPMFLTIFLVRNTSDSVQKFTSFAFPNIDDSHCIAEIQVTWENFMFVSKLTRYTHPLDAIKRIKEVMVEQQSLPRLPPRIQRYLVTLSSSQCQQLWYIMHFMFTKISNELQLQYKQQYLPTMYSLRLAPQCPAFP